MLEIDSNMRNLLTILFLLASILVCSQTQLNPGDHIQSGKIVLKNDKTISFYELKYDEDEKVNYINAESTQPEFLYLSSIKSIDRESVLTQEEIDELERLRAEKNPIITYTSFDNGGEEVKLQNPQPGKAMVYFVRAGDLTGFLINFRHFADNKFIGKFAGSGYLKYECDPGKHIFWVSSSNVKFINAELEADKIYVIETIPIDGIGYAAVRIQIPDRFASEKRYNRQRKRLMRVLANPKYDKSPSWSDLSEPEKYASEINQAAEKYERREKNGENLQLLPIQYFK